MAYAISYAASAAKTLRKLGQRTARRLREQSGNLPGPHAHRLHPVEGRRGGDAYLGGRPSRHLRDPRWGAGDPGAEDRTPSGGLPLDPRCSPRLKRVRCISARLVAKILGRTAPHASPPGTAPASRLRRAPLTPPSARPRTPSGCPAACAPRGTSRRWPPRSAAAPWCPRRSRPPR